MALVSVTCEWKGSNAFLINRLGLTMKAVNQLIKEINELKSNLHEKDFLLTWEQTPQELALVLKLAEA